MLAFWRLVTAGSAIVSASAGLSRPATALALTLLLAAAPVAAGEGLVALTSAAPSCDDGSGDRYVDCGNGTVTDTQSGLVWLQDVNCFGTLTWSDAMLTIAGLASGDCGLTDGSSPGDWRLPSIEEWAAALADAVALSCVSPSLTDDVGTICLTDVSMSAFTNLAGPLAATPRFWSATTVEATPGNVRTMTLVDGSTSGVFSKLNANFAWPVRLTQ